LASGVWVVIAVLAFFLFIRRWIRKGIFHALNDDSADLGLEKLRIE
jgi:hypothetical protein